MKGKGQGFERETCKLLTVWWTGDPESDVIFWRTSQSGGRATFRGRRGKTTTAAHCGDITAIDPRGAGLTNQVTLELKRGYNRTTFGDVLDKPAGAKQQQLEAFLEQTIRAAGRAKTPHWMLIHKRDRRAAVAYFDHDLLVRVQHVLTDYAACWWKIRSAAGRAKTVELAACQLDHFLAAVRPALLAKEG